jgi:long-chain acyl-CoA synthetase
MRKFFYLFSLVYFRNQSKGLKNLKDLDHFIIAPNHFSYLDSMLIELILPRKIRKKTYVLIATEFFRNKFRSAAIRMFGSKFLPIDRFHDYDKGLKEALKLIEEGKVFIVFPEGSRSRTGRMMNFNHGVSYLAYHSDIPVIPAYIHGTFEALKAGSWIPRPSKVRIFFGQPIMMDRYKEKYSESPILEIFAEMTRDIKNAILDLKRDCILSKI